MECRLCNVTKLPDEFAPETVSEECEHPVLFCLRCTLKAVKETSKCPHPGCNIPAKLSDEKMQWFQAILDDMFREYGASDTDEDETQDVPNPLFAGGILTITVLTGESMAVPYDSNMKVLQLKKNISEEMKHPVEKQKLLYKDKELLDCISDGRDAKLSDFGVRPNSTICLVIILFSVPKKFNDVVFDLHWGFPSDGPDFLDASCLMFNGIEFVALCDFSRKQVQAVEHSGDVMDHAKRIGHHTINVSLKSLPSNITHLFFTLSAWSSPDISRYPNPSLKFYEASNPLKDLCKTAFSHAGFSQAVVMCSVSRGSHGRWEIFESGKLSSGNARNYDPIKSTIRSLISQGV